MLISFGYLTKKSFLLLAVPVIMYIRRLIVEKITDNMFYPVFIQFLSRIITGILWAITKKLNVPNEKEKQEKKNKILINFDKSFLTQNNPNKSYENESNRHSAYSECKKDYNKQIKKYKLKKISLLISVCFLDFISISCNTIVRKLKLFKERPIFLISFTVVIRIFVIGLLSYFIIKHIKMYSHHYLSAIIILLVVIITHIISKFTEDYKDYFPKLGLMILPELLFSIMYVCGAKYLSITSGNINKFLFIDGIIGIILSILIQTISYWLIKCENSQNKVFSNNCYCEDDKLKIMFNNFNVNKFNVLYSIALILLTFFETWLIWELILNFSVNHYAAIHPIPLFFYFIINKDANYISNKNFETGNYIMLISVGVIIFLMTFVFNEIIILKFCNLDKNTAVEINKRAERELICDFGDDESDIHTTPNENYLIYNEDIEGSNGGTEIHSELSTY